MSCVAAPELRAALTQNRANYGQTEWWAGSISAPGQPPCSPSVARNRPAPPPGIGYAAAGDRRTPGWQPRRGSQANSAAATTPDARTRTNPRRANCAKSSNITAGNRCQNHPAAVPAARGAAAEGARLPSSSGCYARSGRRGNIEAAVDQIKIPADPADARVRVTAGDDGTLIFHRQYNAARIRRNSTSPFRPFRVDADTSECAVGVRLTQGVFVVHRRVEADHDRHRWRTGCPGPSCGTTRQRASICADMLGGPGNRKPKKALLRGNRR